MRNNKSSFYIDGDVMAKYLLEVNKNIGFWECDLIKKYLEVTKQKDRIYIITEEHNFKEIKLILADMNFIIINQKMSSLEKYEIIANKI